MEISSTYFPPEIVANILVFLPTKYILRFRCVCKSWRDLINGRNPDFSRKSINYQRSIIEKNENCTVILPRCFVYDDNDIFCSRYVRISEAVIFANGLNRNDDHPANLCKMSKRVWGCCDGLVCTVHKSTVMLWNPTINSYKTLPRHSHSHRPAPYRPSKFWIGGIGYDASSADYKILWASYNSLVFVFSVKFNSWKKIEEPFPYVAMYMSSVFVNEGIHMVVLSSQRAKSIVSFDVVTEKFKKLALPSSVNNTTYFFVFAIKGMLGLATRKHIKWQGYEEIVVDLWVMKDYGAGDSWIKFATLHSPKRMDYSHLCKRKRISRLDNTGEVVLEEKRDGWVHNIVRHEHGNDIGTSFKDVNVFVTSDVVVPYVESLLSPLHLSL